MAEKNGDACSNCPCDRSVGESKCSLGGQVRWTDDVLRMLAATDIRRRAQFSIADYRMAVTKQLTVGIVRISNPSDELY